MAAPHNYAAVLLAELTHRGIELAPAADRLRYRPRSAMTPALAEQVKIHKPELLALLRQTSPSGSAGPTSGVIHELSLNERIETGYVNPGWKARAWAERLRQMADRCERDHPDTAAEYRRWAQNVDYREGGRQ